MMSPYVYLALLGITWLADTIAGAYRAHLENSFRWSPLLLALLKLVVYAVIALMFLTGTSTGLLMIVVGREFNSFLQNVGHINDLKGIEDGDVFYHISEWFNLNQRVKQ